MKEDEDEEDEPSEKEKNMLIKLFHQKSCFIKQVYQIRQVYFI